MSTRSTIAIKQDDGKYRAIYCHHDGYLEYVGEMLVNNYKTVERVNALLDLGDLSSLGKEPIGYWSDLLYDEIRCETYRERGVDGVDAIVFSNREDVMDYYSDTEYNYFFENGEWYYLPHRPGQPMKVVDALNKKNRKELKTMFKSDYEKVKKFCEENNIDVTSFEQEIFYKMERQNDIEDIKNYCENRGWGRLLEVDFDRIAEIYRSDHDYELSAWENMDRAIEEYVDVKNRGEQI